MKTNFWLTIGVALITSGLLVRADEQLTSDKTKTPPPVEKSAKKKAVKAPVEKSSAAVEKPIVLSPGAATVSGNHVNVRGKPSFRGEVFTKLKSGDAVTVIEQVIVEKPKAGEPSQWAKIAYPAGVPVWVHSSYVDANKTVKPKKLNVRTGPGENYSVVGVIEHGAAVKEISTKGNWIEIEAPATAIAYVAASYLQQAPSVAAVPPVVSIATPEPPATTNTVPPSPVVATTTIPVSPTNPTTEPAPVPVPDAANAGAPPAVIEEIELPRFVAHEGIVRGTVSVQAPTKYGLYSVENNKLINYLYSPTARLEMSRYYNCHVIVSGQEGLDERWKNTPVLTIQRIQVIQGPTVNTITTRSPITHKGQ
ncbi:MAG: SH3 domain-containing protein [Verrucomicrobiota bacterium]|nr:SH3 domain-containing protein [Verrucomicrobiota bacterium]MCC6820733.1 SH3 domain-containing protein [Limisphaerales bacterium]